MKYVPAAGAVKVTRESFRASARRRRCGRRVEHGSPVGDNGRAGRMHLDLVDRPHQRVPFRCRLFKAEPAARKLTNDTSSSGPLGSSWTRISSRST